MKDQQKFYEDLWDNEIENVIGQDYQHYATKHSGRSKIKIIEQYIAQIPERQSLLEIGCGSGRVLSQFKSMFCFEKGYGIDISSTAINFASQQNSDCSFFVLNIDQDRLPWEDGEIDVVILCDIVEHVKDVDHLLKEAVRVGKNVVIKVPLERTLLEYIKTICGKETSLNKRHKLGHIQSFNYRNIRKLLRQLDQESNLQIEMINKKELKPRRNFLLDVISRLLYRYPLYRWVFHTDLGIHIRKVQSQQ